MSNYGIKPLLRYGALAAALGAITWVAAPYLLPMQLPADFPKLPDLAKVNAGMRAAIESADHEARRKPASADAMGKLGMAYDANLYLEQAARAYRIAARLAPGDYRWAYAQAVIAEENGQDDEQLEFLRTTVKLAPDNAPALVKLGDRYFKQDRLDEAAHYYEAASKAAGGGASLQATYGLSRVASRRQDWHQVVERVAPLAASYPYVQPVHELLAQAYDALGQKDRAVGARRAIQSATLKLMPPPDDALNDRLIAVCYSSTRLLKQAGLESRQGRPERAIQVARRAAEANPSDADIRNFLARTLLTYYGNKPESVEQALTELGECLRLKPDDPVPLYGFSSDFFENPQPPASVARIDALLRPYANRTDAHFYLGLVADAEGRTDEAVAQYQAALKENPKQSGVYNKLGVMENKAGRFEAAMAYFQRSIQVDPMNAAARLNLGVSLLQRGRDAQGLKELHEVLRLKPNDSAAHFCIAFSHLYAKKPAEAIPEFQEGLRFKPDDPEGHFGLASALFLVRQRDEAAKELREALRLRPGYPEAQQLLQTLER